MLQKPEDAAVPEAYVCLAFEHMEEDRQHRTTARMRPPSAVRLKIRVLDSEVALEQKLAAASGRRRGVPDNVARLPRPGDRN